MKACDIDDGREDVQEMVLCEVRDLEEQGEPVSLDVQQFTTLDACAACRAAISNGGLATLVALYAEAHRPKRRRAAKPTTAPGTTTA